MIVTLTHAEMLRAGEVGVMRRISAIKAGRQDRYGAPTSDLWGIDIEGACAELAVAKLLGGFWNAIARDPIHLPGDVGTMQVRSTTLANGRLILHKQDPDDARFYLVRGRAPRLEVCGWILGRDGKRDEWWDNGDGRAAYFVPASALRDDKGEPIAPARQRAAARW